MLRSQRLNKRCIFEPFLQKKRWANPNQPRTFVCICNLSLHPRYLATSGKPAQKSIFRCLKFEGKKKPPTQSWKNQTMMLSPEPRRTTKKARSFSGSARILRPIYSISRKDSPGRYFFCFEAGSGSQEPKISSGCAKINKWTKKFGHSQSVFFNSFVVGEKGVQLEGGGWGDFSEAQIKSDLGRKHRLSYGLVRKTCESRKRRSHKVSPGDHMHDAMQCVRAEQYSVIEFCGVW